MKVMGAKSLGLENSQQEQVRGAARSGGGRGEERSQVSTTQPRSSGNCKVESRGKEACLHKSIKSSWFPAPVLLLGNDPTSAQYGHYQTHCRILGGPEKDSAIPARPPACMQDSCVGDTHPDLIRRSLLKRQPGKLPQRKDAGSRTTGVD